MTRLMKKLNLSIPEFKKAVVPETKITLETKDAKIEAKSNGFEETKADENQIDSSKP